MSKSAALEILRRRVIHEHFVARWEDVWFFPEHDGVKGWKGTAPIVFVGLNPSTGRFPSKADSLFYESLRSNRLHNAHLTDAFKTRLTNREAQEKLIKGSQHRGYMLQELDIIKPRLIVGLGARATEFLKAWLSGGQRKRLATIWHYAYAQRWGRTREFQRQMAGVAASFRG